MKRAKGPRTWAVGHVTLPLSTPALDDGALTWGDPAGKSSAALDNVSLAKATAFPFIHIYPQLLHPQRTAAWRRHGTLLKHSSLPPRAGTSPLVLS